MADPVVGPALETRAGARVHVNHAAPHVRHAHRADAQTVRKPALDAFRFVHSSSFRDLGSSAKRGSTFTLSPSFLRKSATYRARASSALASVSGPNSFALFLSKSAREAGVFSLSCMTTAPSLVSRGVWNTSS